jgi:hypothetical protein
MTQAAVKLGEFFSMQRCRQVGRYTEKSKPMIFGALNFVLAFFPILTVSICSLVSDSHF